MAKFYKIEMQDFGWAHVLGIFDTSIKEQQKEIDRLEKLKAEGKLPEMFEGLPSVYEMYRNLISRYKREFESQLKEQNFPFESFYTGISEHIT